VPGTTLAHYEILALLGRGGMGEVHRARDTKLGREVALKLLPPDFAADPERLARFRREAKVLASLHHPNIAGIFGLEEADGRVFLAMELAEGADLSQRIARGPIPEEEALDIARQLAAGLEEAHEKGVVHRDLKPANIKLGTDGKVKILDFGLARAFAGETAEEELLENSPTITATMSRGGVILGTAAYMSPEQARGRKVDRRADIWAFGAVLFEMLSGTRLFEGETISDTLAAVLRADIEWDRLPEDVSPGMRRLLERCLERDPLRRLRDIGEARVFLENGAQDSSLLASSVGALPLAAAEFEGTGRSGRAGWTLALVMALAAIVLGTLLFTRPSAPTLTRTTLGLTEEEAIGLANRAAFSSVRISPDGTSVVFVGGHPGAIYIRAIDSFDTRKLVDTEGAMMPVFSPDGRWIAFFAKSKLWKVAVSGGAPIEIYDLASDTGTVRGLAWGNGELYFPRAMGGGLLAVSENGGEARSISTLDDARGDTSHRWPYVLPGGRHLLMTIKTASIASFDDASIGLLSLESGELTVLLQGGSSPRYAPTGYLVYGRHSQLFAVPFDLKTLSVEGTPTPVLDEVYTSDVTGSAQYALDPQGDLVYVPTVSDFWDFKLFWLGRSGDTAALEVDQPRGYDAALSPDGTRFAAAVAAANDKIWVYDLQRNTTSRLTNTPGNDRDPVWSPDGTRVSFQNDRSGSRDLYLIAVDGGGPAEKLLTSASDDFPTDWSPDGERLIFTRVKTDGDIDIWELTMNGDREARPYIQSPHREYGAVFSPDGGWVAYVSDSSGEPNVYVRPYPGPGNPMRISISGGDFPFWSRDGHTLFYAITDRLMAVSVDRSGGFRAGKPKEFMAVAEPFMDHLSPAPDGQRFLTTKTNLDAKQDQIRVLFDWAETLREFSPRD